MSALAYIIVDRDVPDGLLQFDEDGYGRRFVRIGEDLHRRLLDGPDPPGPATVEVDGERVALWVQDYELEDLWGLPVYDREGPCDA